MIDPNQSFDPEYFWWLPENMDQLKREVEAGCRRFWKKRGMEEPKSQFNHMDFSSHREGGEDYGKSKKQEASSEGESDSKES